MYPLGIDDRLKTTPIVESLVLPHPLYQGDRLSSPTSIGLCITHPSLNKALEFGVSSPSCQDPPQGVLPSPMWIWGSTLTDLSLRGFYRTGGRRSGAIGLVSCEFCVCSSCSSRGVCSLPLPSPFPLAFPSIWPRDPWRSGHPRGLHHIHNSMDLQAPLSFHTDDIHRQKSMISTRYKVQVQCWKRSPWQHGSANPQQISASIYNIDDTMVQVY